MAIPLGLRRDLRAIQRLPTLRQGRPRQGHDRPDSDVTLAISYDEKRFPTIRLPAALRPWFGNRLPGEWAPENGPSTSQDVE